MKAGDKVVTPKGPAVIEKFERYRRHEGFGRFRDAFYVHVRYPDGRPGLHQSHHVEAADG